MWFYQLFDVNVEVLNIDQIKKIYPIINDKNILGTAIGFNNMAVISGGIFLQPIVSFLLDYSAKHQDQLEIILSKPNFQYAFIVIPIVSIIGLVLSQCVLKESLKPQP